MASDPMILEAELLSVGVTQRKVREGAVEERVVGIGTSTMLPAQTEDSHGPTLSKTVEASPAAQQETTPAQDADAQPGSDASAVPQTHLEPPTDTAILEIIAPPAAERETDARNSEVPTTPLSQGGSLATVSTPVDASRPPPGLVSVSSGDVAPGVTGTAALAGASTAVKLSVGTPTPREAARRLARYAEEVKSTVQSSLIKSPPKQKPLQWKPTLPIRSSRITG